MTPGQSYAVSVTMQNTGGKTWTAATNHRLGSQNPQDNTTWGGNRVNLPATTVTAANATFSFNVTAPTTAGTYNFQWKMVQDLVEWFGAQSANATIKVGLDNAAFVSQSVPTTMLAGQGYPVSVTMQNTGSTTWAASTVGIGSQNPQDNLTWGGNRVLLSTPVAPSASRTFNFNVTAPSAPGTYNFQWRLVEGTNGWFGAQSTNVAVSVVPGTPQANVYFIHTDHLNTPRLVANSIGTTVWRWDQQEPFGVNVPDENPSGLGAFEFPMRFPASTSTRRPTYITTTSATMIRRSGDISRATRLGSREALIPMPTSKTIRCILSTLLACRAKISLVVAQNRSGQFFLIHLQKLREIWGVKLRGSSRKRQTSFARRIAKGCMLKLTAWSTSFNAGIGS